MVAVNAMVLVTIFLIPIPIIASAYSDLQNSNGPKEPTARPPWNATETDLLKRTLLVGYDKFARPSHLRRTTNVSLSIAVYHVELDDFTSVMTVHGWVKMKWTDDKLKWNSSDYGGLKNLHLADHELWQPDIVQYNSASGNAVDQFGNTHCLVTENGSVIWVPPAKLTTFCNMDLKNWPQDEQACVFTFGSWTYDGYMIDLLPEDISNWEIINDYNLEGGEWELVSVSQQRFEKTYPCCENHYVSVNYGVHVRRLGGGSIRAALLRTPAIVAVLLSLLSHCLSSTSPRLTLVAVSPSLLSIGLLYLAHRLPSPRSTPNIVLYYCVCLYVSCLSGVISVIVVNISSSRRTLPWGLRRVLCSRAAKCLRLPQLAKHPAGEELQNTIGGSNGSATTEEGVQILSESPTPARDWLALTTAIDRISFIILLLIFIFISIFTY